MQPSVLRLGLSVNNQLVDTLDGKHCLNLIYDIDDFLPCYLYGALS